MTKNITCISHPFFSGKNKKENKIKELLADSSIHIFPYKTAYVVKNDVLG